MRFDFVSFFWGFNIEWKVNGFSGFGFICYLMNTVNNLKIMKFV